MNQFQATIEVTPKQVADLIVEDAPECQRDVMPVASNNPPPTED